MKTSTYRDRKGWASGAWDGEPDKVQWINWGFDCLIVRGPVGALCGYVGVPPTHPYFKRDYDQVDGIDVHGGLTFAGLCDPSRGEEGICHTGDVANPEVRWFGFDCAHLGDVIPGIDGHGLAYEGSYKDIAYVTRETNRLASQLAQITS